MLESETAYTSEESRGERGEGNTVRRETIAGHMWTYPLTLSQPVRSGRRIPDVAAGVPAPGWRGGWRDCCIVTAPNGAIDVAGGVMVG